LTKEETIVGELLMEAKKEEVFSVDGIQNNIIKKTGHI